VSPATWLIICCHSLETTRQVKTSSLESRALPKRAVRNAVATSMSKTSCATVERRARGRKLVAIRSIIAELGANEGMITMRQCPLSQLQAEELLGEFLPLSPQTLTLLLC
jgi:hypothetical protein